MAQAIIDVPMHLTDLVKNEEHYDWPSPLLGTNIDKDIHQGTGFLPEDGFMEDGNFVICGKSQVNIKEVA